MVSLQPMSAEGFDRWWSRLWTEYRAELIAAGSTDAEADENISQNLSAVYPDGQLAPGNHVFDVINEEDVVGCVWLADRGDEWFIYDIEVTESLRGRGMGRATMQAIEQFVRGRGGNRIGLSVFGHNATAQKLYLSEGYEITRLSMLKKLN